MGPPDLRTVAAPSYLARVGRSLRGKLQHVPVVKQAALHFASSQDAGDSLPKLAFLNARDPFGVTPGHLPGLDGRFQHDLKADRSVAPDVARLILPPPPPRH